MVWLVVESFVLLLLTTALGLFVGIGAKHMFAAGYGRGPALAGAAAAAGGHGHARAALEPSPAPTPAPVAPPIVAVAPRVEPTVVAPPEPPVVVPAEEMPAAVPAAPTTGVEAAAPAASGGKETPEAPAWISTDPVAAPVEATAPAAPQPIAAAPVAAEVAPADEAAAEPVAPADGIIDAEKAASADQVGVRPNPLAGPRDGQPDNLKKIKGIGPLNEARLNALGIYHFDQIAAWSTDEAKWVGTYLAFPGRIEREKWVEQAATLKG
ncbi:hypothetical protein [Chthonobacter rhizosphaerae]|uniref:hypothetical protein n=1 Tax=Chthonobacter rhizosphaerae TaxID=2735553 RepID=UPI001FEAB4B5|nr:hypothetical protein [Chthonobacter rhizosphaerae]